MAAEESPHPITPEGILVTHREFTPHPKESNTHKFNPQEAVVIYQGWGPTKDATSYGPTAQEFADRYNRRTFLMNTLPESPIPDSLRQEAEKTHEYLAGTLNITDAVVVGYSEGGGLAINTILECQDKKKITPRALVLLAPIGISSDSPQRLVTAFAADSALTPLRVITTPSRHSITHTEYTKRQKLSLTAQAAKDVVNGVYAEAKTTGLLKYPIRLIHDIKLMVQQNPRLKDITCPVVIIQGKDDLPKGPQGELKKSQMAKQDPDHIVQQALEKLFPNSHHVSRIKLTRDSSHIGSLIRSSQIAKVTSALLDHWENPKSLTFTK